MAATTAPAPAHETDEVTRRILSNAPGPHTAATTREFEDQLTAADEAALARERKAINRALDKILAAFTEPSAPAPKTAAKKTTAPKQTPDEAKAKLTETCEAIIKSSKLDASVALSPRGDYARIVLDKRPLLVVRITAKGEIRAMTPPYKAADKVTGSVAQVAAAVKKYAAKSAN